MLDVAIRGGRVVDGAGSPWFSADVGIAEGRIVRVGQILDEAAARTIPADGLVVCPGFIDIHSHADFVLPVSGHMHVLAPLLRQGITTLVTGNCGLSAAPVAVANEALLHDYTLFLQAAGFNFEWRTHAEFCQALEARGVGFNVVPLTSHGAVRIAVMGFAAGEPTVHQMVAMQALVKQAMEEGAFGLSAGLIYAPGMYASTQELIDVTKPLAPYQGVFTCHIRGSSETGVLATQEVIAIGRANGIPVEHSHMEIFGEPNWGQIDEIIAIHDGARAEGVDVTFDVIPYTTANTTLGACFPPYAFEGGMDAFVQRLQDPAMREQLRHDVATMESEWPTWRPGTWPQNLARATGWGNIRLMWAASPANARYAGLSFEEIGRRRNTTPFDAVADILVEENGTVLALYIGVSGDLETEDGFRKILSHPNGAINTDAILTGRGMPHPAAYGAFPRVLGQYVRELGILRLEEAVRKMTSLPARRFNIQDRGLVREGMWADLVVFDPETIRDNSTHLDPAHEPTGVEYVLVNGHVAVARGALDERQLAGQVLRRA